MKLFPLNKALLWKEWRQNRWLFWVGLCLVSISPIVVTVLSLFQQLVEEGGFYRGITNYLKIYLGTRGTIPFFLLATIAAVMLGSILLAQERGFSHPVEFLTSTPVSRREVVTAKFVTGLYMIWAVLLLNLVFILLTGLQPPYYPWDMWLMAVGYFLQQGLALTAVYSMSFCVSTLFGNLFSSLFGCGVIVSALPWLLHSINTAWSSQFMYVENQFFQFLQDVYLPNYAIEGHFGQWWIVPVMLQLIPLFYTIAVWLFEKSPFEKNGHILVFGNFWSAMKWIAPLILALAASAQIYRPWASVVVFLLVFGAIFVMLVVVQRVRKSFGFR